MTRSTARSKPTIKERSATAISVLLLVGLFAAAGAIMAYYFLKNPDILFSGKKTYRPSATVQHVRLSGENFFIPQYLIAKVERSALRKVKKIRLAFRLDWQPGASPTALTANSDMSEWIMASIAPGDPPPPKKTMLKKIYRLYVAGPAIAHSSGLLRYRFLPNSPYGEIELFVDDLESPKTLIRCELIASRLGARFCARTIAFKKNLLVDYHFTRASLGKWRQIDKTVHAVLQNIYKSGQSNQTADKK